MAAPAASVAPSSALSLALFKPAGMLHDAAMQARLHAFCVAKAAACPAALREWLAPPAQRPLWQLSVVATVLNGGIVMLTDGAEDDAVHLACTVPLLGALVPAPCAAVPLASEAAPPEAEAAAQSPYEYEAHADDASFERELHNLSLTAGGAGEPDRR